ncbi:hypothetical protein [Salinibacterium sp. ZJ450]|uniref:hypothetical protein n=1 Tax=Salinibacterium sp. ZJ450 TaxID=2708338 RepID=UPI00141FB104|nr:hypothetical protein [Salinibacterium sp. ZJ450]
MSTTSFPRITFTEFQDSRQHMLVSFLAQVQSITLAEALSADAHTDETSVKWPTDPLDGTVVWRLMASNRKELGRTVRSHRSFELARRNALALVAGVDELEGKVIRAGRRAVGWYLGLYGVPMLVCGELSRDAGLAHAAMGAASDALRRVTVADRARLLRVEHSGGPLGINSSVTRGPAATTRAEPVSSSLRSGADAR